MKTWRRPASGSTASPWPGRPHNLGRPTFVGPRQNREHGSLPRHAISQSRLRPPAVESLRRVGMQVLGFFGSTQPDASHLQGH
jgi:hypothetical protein